MRLVTFQRHGDVVPGAIVHGHVIDLIETAQAANRVNGDSNLVLVLAVSLRDLLEGGPDALDAVRSTIAFAADPENLTALVRLGLAFPEDQVDFLPPLVPGKILCVGQNYRKHIAEMKRTDTPPYPVFFSKFSNTLVGHGHAVHLPEVSDRVDYEAELAVVIGKRARRITPDQVFDYIAGYTIINDVSVRDYQYRTSQWDQGKTFDDAAPIGPAIVTRDEIPDPAALEIILRLNGQEMQHGNTADLIFSIPTLVSYLSDIMTLEPGDVIATGTPDGVGHARDPQVYLRDGDTVEIMITGVGTLRHTCIREEA